MRVNQTVNAPLSFSSILFSKPLAILRARAYEEADAYAETLGGYCDGLHKIGKKTVWTLLVKQE